MVKGKELVVKIVELAGSYYAFGLEQGRELKSFPYIDQLDELGKLTAHSDVQKAKEVMESVSPKLFQELLGLAEGLDLPVDKAFQLFSGYDVKFPTMGCTTLVQDGYYVRNYDFSPDMYDARLVWTKPTNGYASVGFSQQVIGRLDGMNEKGLVVGLHFVNNEHHAQGFIATTIVRMLLEHCANIEEVLTFITTIPHGYCYNYSMTDRSGKSVIVEAAPHQQVFLPTNPLICTNHFESKGLTEKNRSAIQGSLKRKEHLHQLLANIVSPLSAYQQFNHGSSPLFYKYYQEFFGTLHTVVYSPKDLSIIVGVGENCQPLMFSLKEYMEGTFTLPNTVKGWIDFV
jgi:predicted choloylglycine hydrolase